MKKISFKQKGATLILAAFIIALAATVYVLKAYDPAQLRLEQDKKTYMALNEAKKALIAWSVNHPNMPGIMPYPDRNGDGNYDDTSDCYASNINFAPHFVLGRLPLFRNDPNCITTDTIDTSGVHDTPAVNGLSLDLRDGIGERIWYEVSRNLLHDYKSSAMHSNGASPVINPSIINNPSNTWMVVRDRNGIVLSNRVAVVIFSPGEALNNQDRSGGAANPNQYLDKIIMADNTPYQNYGYPDPATNPVQEFIIADDYRTVSKTDSTYKDQNVEPYYYNDKLAYITIDELMYALEKRALEQAKDALNKFKTTNGFYPFAAGLGSVTNPNQCTQGNLRGLLPVNTALDQVCTCTSLTRTCNCNFNTVRSISFTRSTGSFAVNGSGANAPTGACSVLPANNKMCTCNGAGACRRASGAIQFSCNSCGTCTATVAGVNKFDTTGEFSAGTGSCVYAPSALPTLSSATCPTTADGTFTLSACNANETINSVPTVGGLLPAWFLANQWEKYIVYAVSNDCVSTGGGCLSNTSPPKITVGLNQNINALIAGSLVNSVASCSIANYLNSTENVNLVLSNGLQDSIYQKPQVKTQANTDQLVTIP